VLPEDETSTSAPDVGRQTFRAAAWGFVGAAGKRVLTLVGLMLLARVLDPHEFGVIGFAMLYLTMVEVVGDLGTGEALVYWPERRDDATQVTFVVNVIAGVFWCLTSLLVAPLVADFFHEPNGAVILRVLSVTTFIKFLGNTHDALAKKDLRFRSRTGPELALTGIKSAVALVLAWMGFGAWSLVWGHIAGIAAWTILLWFVVPWRPSLRMPKDLLAPMLRYGRGILAVELLAAFMFYVDVVGVGRYLGVTALALYQMASRIPDSSIMVLIWVAASALFPAFSKLHAEGADIQRAYLVATRCMAAMTLPACLGLAFLARPVILVFFGPHWAAAAPILSILSIYVGFRGLDEVGNVLKATGRVHTLVWLTVAKAIALVPAIIISARISAPAVAAALAIVYGAGTLVTTVIAARIIGIPIRAIALAYARSAEAAAVMSAVLFAWMHLATPLPPIAQLAGGLLLGGGVYVGALRLFDAEIFAWIRNVLRSPRNAASDVLAATRS
jgi:O-antigen/teichoic acid export membrane protein